MTDLDIVRAHLDSLGLPTGDLAIAPTSPLRFADGGWYKWEVAGAFDGPSIDALAAALAEHGIRLHQVTNTVGGMRYLDSEIEAMVAAARRHGLQFRMSVGPRGLFDIGGQHLAGAGVASASAYRLRGMDQLVTAGADALRSVALGVNGFLVFDEGSLVLLESMRRAGVIPEGVKFKASSNMGANNPLHARLLAEQGADSVNMQRDLGIPMLAAVRAATDAALDLHTDNPRQTGGFVRGYDVPEMVRVAAPVYLKSGNAAQDFADTAPRPAEIDAIAHQIALDDAMLTRYLPEATASDTPEL